MVTSGGTLFYLKGTIAKYLREVKGKIVKRSSTGGMAVLFLSIFLDLQDLSEWGTRKQIYFVEWLKFRRGMPMGRETANCLWKLRETVRRSAR